MGFDYKPHKPSYQDDYKPNYQDDYKPTYQDDYKPPYEDKPTYQDDYKPNYQFDGDYKPPYDDKPNYQDDYKPTGQDQYNNKPPYEDEFSSPFDNDGYKPDLKPIDFDTNFFGSDDQKPSVGYGDDQYENPKPYVPPQYDNYEPYEPPKPVIPKPYKPVTPKPYKPRPTYPKEIVLLQPSTALKSSAYADKYPSDYRPSSVPGTPGKDYPNFTSVPETSFDCLKYTNLDFSYMYGDIEAGCQVFEFYQFVKPFIWKNFFLRPLGFPLVPPWWSTRFVLVSSWHNFRRANTDLRLVVQRSMYLNDYSGKCYLKYADTTTLLDDAHQWQPHVESIYF